MSEDAKEELKGEELKEEEKITMGRRIRERRLYLRRKSYGTYTQEYVADKLGMSRVGYAHYETGRNSISHQLLTRLAVILDVPVNYFYGIVEEEAIEDEYAISLYRGLPDPAKRTVDSLINDLHAMLKVDDASEELHGKVIGGTRTE